MDQTPRLDLIVALHNTETVDAIVEAGHIHDLSLRGTIPIPTGPVIEEGEHNFKRY